MAGASDSPIGATVPSIESLFGAACDGDRSALARLLTDCQLFYELRRTPGCRRLCRHGSDGTPEAARRIERVLWNDPASGVMRHADAGYDDAIACAKAHGLKLPSVGAA